MMLRRLLAFARPLLFVGGLVAVSTEAWAEEEIRPAQQAKLIVHLLGHDRNLATRAGDVIRIAVIFREGFPDSEAMKSDIATSLEEVGKQSSSGQRVEVVKIAFSSSAQLQGALSSARYAAIYVCTGLAHELPTISSVSRKSHVLSFSSLEDYAKRGLAISLIARDSRPVMVINLPAAKAEGADLSSEALRLALVLR